MLRQLRHRLRPGLAVDVGTSNTVIAVRGGVIAVDEPSVVALREGTRQILGRGMAVGRLAKQMVGRVPEGVAAVRPIRAGAVVDFELCEAMLRYYVRKAGPQRFGVRPTTVVTVAHGATSVEKRAPSATERAGTGQTFLLSTAFAAAISAGLPINEPVASMVCDLGGGTTEIAVFSLGEIVSGTTLRTGGDDWNAAIVDHVRRTFSLKIGPQSAEQLKLELGSADRLPEERTCEVGGLDAFSEFPRKALVTSEDIREAALHIPRRTRDESAGVLEACPPELVADLAEQGLGLTGGSSLLRNLSSYLGGEVGIPCRVADQPMRAAVEGARICLENPRVWDYCLEASV